MFSTLILSPFFSDMEDIEILDEDDKKRLFAVKNVKYVQPVWVRYLSFRFCY